MCIGDGGGAREKAPQEMLQQPKAWAARLGAGTRGNAQLNTTLALEEASRQGAFRRSLREERRLARERGLDAYEMKMLYSVEAMDIRCALRHSPEVARSLRAWARTVESFERQRTGGSAVIICSAEMYYAALMRCSLALTMAATEEELDAYVRTDWVRPLP